jgi:hypothetical protein
MLAGHLFGDASSGSETVAVPSRTTVTCAHCSAPHLRQRPGVEAVERLIAEFYDIITRTENPAGAARNPWPGRISVRRLGYTALPKVHSIMPKIKKPSIKLTVTPPTIMIRRCQAGLERNSQGCGRQFEGFGVHTFIDHTGYFHIAAQGQPANTVFGIASFYFPKGIKGRKIKEQSKIFPPGF